MGGQELLSRGSGLELLLLSLTPTDREVGVFGPVVLPHSAWLMAIRQPEISGRSPVRSQLVRHDRLWSDALVFQQFPKQFESRALVATLLDQHVQDLAFVVHGPPEIHPLAADFHHHLVEMPATGRPWP